MLSNDDFDILRFVHKALQECDPISDEDIVDMSSSFLKSFGKLVRDGLIDYDVDCGMYSISNAGLCYIEESAGQLTLPDMPMKYVMGVDVGSHDGDMTAMVIGVQDRDGVVFITHVNSYNKPMVIDATAVDVTDSRLLPSGGE